MAHVITNVEEFNNIINNGVTLVDFYTTWCGPCKMLAPIIEEVAKEFEGLANVVKVDVEELRELGEKYQIVSVPTVMIFKDGEMIAQTSGFRPKQQFCDALNKVLKM